MCPGLHLQESHHSQITLRNKNVYKKSNATKRKMDPDKHDIVLLKAKIDDLQYQNRRLRALLKVENQNRRVCKLQDHAKAKFEKGSL